MADHVHLCVSIPPKYSVANTAGFLKGESAIRIRRERLGRQRNFTGFHSWARGYCVSTVGLDEQTVRAYMRAQEVEEKRQEQLPLGAFRLLHTAEAPLEGPSSNHPLCGWYLIYSEFD